MVIIKKPFNYYKMKKTLLAITFLIFTTTVFSQQDWEVLKNINGIEISYRKQKIQEKKNTIVWSIEFEYRNTLDKDLYYKSYYYKKTEGILDFISNKNTKGYDEYLNFIDISVENQRGFLASSYVEVYLSGDKTRLKTDNNESIMSLKKFKTYTKSLEVKLDEDDDPVIKVSAINSISFTNDLTDFL